MTGGRTRLGILAALALLVLLPATASAEGASVRFLAQKEQDKPQNGVTLPLADLGSPDIEKPYLIGGTPKEISGYSLGLILESAKKMDDGKWLGEISIDRFNLDSAGRDSPLLNIPIAALNGESPPVFYENNAGATVFVQQGIQREYVYTGTPVLEVIPLPGKKFKVTLSHSPKRPRPGQKVSFSAEVTGSPSGAKLSYRWRFGDGTTKTTSSRSVVHTYANKGRRSVSLTVTGESGSGVGTLSIDVVEDPKGGDRPRPKPGGNPMGDSGGSSGIGGYGGSTSGFGSGYGSGFGGFPGTGSIGSPDSAPLPPEAEDRPAEVSPEGLEQVSGVVIDPAASASAAAPEAGGPAGEDLTDDGAFGLSGEAATLLGVGLLIALGALIETRILSRRL